MTWVTAVASVAAAQQASAIGKYNQSIQNRNAEVAEQEAERLNQQLEFDLARFDQQFSQLVGEQKVVTAKSGVEYSGTALRIARANAEQAEIQKDVMEYNSKVAQNKKLEEANFARMQGSIARQTARATAIGYYSQAAVALAPYGKSLLGSQTQSSNQYIQANLNFARNR